MSDECNSEATFVEEEEEELNEWEVLKADNDYEINVNYPYVIRKIENGKILKESDRGNGYLVVYLNGKHYYKHRLIAGQWIPNPDNLGDVDHIDHNRTNNDISNLRWVSHKQNMNNKGRTNNGREVEYIQTLPDDTLLVEHYSKWNFENLFFCINNDRFYIWNGINYRIIEPCLINNGMSYVIGATDTNNTRHLIYYTKFKKQYNLD